MLALDGVIHLRIKYLIEKRDNRVVAFGCCQTNANPSAAAIF